jgi:Zn-dependent peptidase ImmA (M78 family)
VIYGARIKQARLFIGETQEQFGLAIGLPQSRMPAVENDNTQLSEDSLMLACEHTGFPPEFFERPPAAPVAEYQFRARTRFKAAERNRVIRCAEMVHESYALMRQEAASVPVRVPDLREVAPTAAAHQIRASLDLHPHQPIPNLLLPIERLGVVVLALPVHGKKHDAFSWWQLDAKPYPVITVLAGAPGDRLRWNLAHELGHVVLHPEGGAGTDVEREADAFAAELLTPLDAVRGEMPAHPTLSALYAMKLRWGVSAQSLIRRARDLGTIGDDRYMSLFRQLSARGERMNERHQIRREKPRGYRKMAEVLFGEQPAAGLAAMAAWTEDFAHDVLDQFATKGELPRSRTPLPASGHLAEVVYLRR